MCKPFDDRELWLPVYDLNSLNSNKRKEKENAELQSLISAKSFLTPPFTTVRIVPKFPLRKYGSVAALDG
jgi:hypothetical protein